MNASQAPTVRPNVTDYDVRLWSAQWQYAAWLAAQPEAPPVYCGQPRSLPYLYWGAVALLAVLPLLWHVV